MADAPESKKRARAGSAAAEDEPEPSAARFEESDEEEYCPMPAKWAKKDVAAAMLWFYRDKGGKRQGPFYPGQMRQWWSAGFFKPDQLVAPSFKGEVPREYVKIEQFFPDDERLEAAFVAREGVALWPPAQVMRPPEDYDAETRSRAGDADRPKWLEDSVRRQRAGIHFVSTNGPVERENYN